MAASDEGQGAPWQTVGSAEYRFEPPDIVFSRSRGDLTMPEAVALFDFIRKRAAERRPLFWLHDNADSPSPPPELRKYAAEQFRTLPVDGMVTFGGSFQSRILAKLATHAAALLSSGAALPASFIADTESAARAWIEQRRRALRG